MEMKKTLREMLAIAWWHSIDLGPELGVTPGREPNPRSRDVYMNIPWDQMRGKRVIDVGAWDGLYSFEAERAGARVVAVEPNRTEGLLFAKSVLSSKVEVLQEELSGAEGIPEADFVFFFGVLYHLKNPYYALESCYDLLKPGGLLILETALGDFDVNRNGIDVPFLEFCEHERDGDPTNWNYPNKAWVEASLRTVGFEEISYQGGSGRLRAAWHARVPR